MEYSQLAYSVILIQHSEVRACVRLLSSLFLQMKRRTECCAGYDGGRQRIEEPTALIPDVGDEGRQCGRSNNILLIKVPAYDRFDESNREKEREKEREREREAQRG